MEPIIKVNKFEAFIRLGQLNHDNLPWKREHLIRLNSIINNNLDKEIELGEYRSYIEVSDENKDFLMKLKLYPISRKKGLKNHGLLNKIFMIFWK